MGGEGRIRGLLPVWYFSRHGRRKESVWKEQKVERASRMEIRNSAGSVDILGMHHGGLMPCGIFCFAPFKMPSSARISLSQTVL